MKIRTILPLLVLVPAAADAQAPSPGAAPGCAAEFAWITDYAARNYSGFEYKTAGEAGERYHALLAELRPLAEAATSTGACDAILNRWVSFFRDGHISVRRRAEQAASAPAGAPESDDAIRARFADRERLELTEAEARTRIEARGASRTPLEGIWQLGDAYRVAVVRDERPGRDYTMTTLRADSVWWTPGQVKAIFADDGSGGFRVRFFMRDHSEMAWTARVARNVLLFDQGSRWFRVWPLEPGDVTAEELAATQNQRFGARELWPGTVLVQIPTFDDTPGIDALFETEGERMRDAERLIIDLRGNGGGSDFNWRPLIPLIYTRPIRVVGNMALATDDNLLANERLAADTTIAEGIRDWLRGWIAQVEPARGGWYAFPDDSIVHPAVLERPRTVAVLVDRGCASSCEAFLLAARQSAKVTLYGDRTAGILDFGNVRAGDMPHGTLRLQHATTRTKRLPHDPVDPDGIQPHVRIPREELFPVEWVLRYLAEAETAAR